MLIGAYGMFWDREDVDWTPGSGRAWRLLGRRNTYRPALKVADFRRAHGVYVLFNNKGANYVGIARGRNGLGGRLKDHLVDEHAASWNRFCWFAFDEVLGEYDAHGLNVLRPRNEPSPSSSKVLIEEIEALLITLMSVQNARTMKFKRAVEWTQVHPEDRDYYLEAVASRQTTG